MSGSKKISFSSEIASGAEISTAISFRLSSDAVSLLQTGQGFAPGAATRDLPAFLDIPPLYVENQTGEPPQPDTLALDNAGASNPDAPSADDTGNGGSTQDGLDPSLSIQQLIANGTFGSNLVDRAAAFLDEHESQASQLLNFFGLNGDKVLGAIDSVLGDAGAWLSKDTVDDPAQLTLTTTTDLASANFIVNVDGSIICNKAPLAGQTTVTIATADSIYGLTDAQKESLQQLTDYLTQSLSKENNGETIAPAVDPALASLLAEASPSTDQSNQPLPFDNTTSGGGTTSGGSSGGGDSSAGGGGSSGGGGGDSGGGGGDSGGGNYNTPQSDQSPIAIPADAVQIPQDTAPQQWLKAVDATINGNGLGPDRYDAVSGPTSDGYSVGAYNTSATGMVDWIFGLSDAELDDIEDDEYDEEGGTTTDKSKGGKDKAKGGKGGHTQHRDRKHVFRRGTAARLRHLRDELRAFEKEHGKEPGILTADGHFTQDGIKAFLAQRPQSAGRDDDGLIKLLTDMSSTSPESKAAVQADLQAAFDPEHTNQDTSFDPALQELMATDLLKIYGEAYKQAHPEANLTDPEQLKQAAGVLMLAMHLGHYPTADEIAADSQNATGIISITNAEITRRSPQAQSGTFDPINQYESRLGNDMLHLDTGMQGRAGRFAYEDTIATDSLIQSRILAAANEGRGDQMWRLIQNGASGPVEGCAASVSAILNGAGVANVNEMTVVGLEQELLRQGWTIDTVARPGDVVVGYGGKSSGHTGIVGTDGTVYDNKSYDADMNVYGQWQQESLDYFENWNTVRFLRPPAHFDTYTFPYGQCTYWAALNHATYFADGASYGNAYQWIDSAHRFGIETTNVPSVGAIVVYKRGNGYDADYGHVAIVTAVSGNTYTVSEMNYDEKGDGKVTTRTIEWPDSHVEGFIP